MGRMVMWELKVLAVIACVVCVCDATEYTVGDEKGWTLGVDYEKWAEGKEFVVGDALVFKYGEGSHNVYNVSGVAFANCTKTPNLGEMKSGNDRVELKEEGRMWFICAIAQHCSNGMKLKITVNAAATAPSSPLSDAAPSHSNFNSLPFLFLVLLSLPLMLFY